MKNMSRKSRQARKSRQMRAEVKARRGIVIHIEMMAKENDTESVSGPASEAFEFNWLGCDPAMMKMCQRNCADFCMRVIRDERPAATVKDDFDIDSIMTSAMEPQMPEVPMAEEETLGVIIRPACFNREPTEAELFEDLFGAESVVG